jgi:hypothetical protein
MTDFTFVPHYETDPYTGRETFPDCIELRVGYNVLGRLHMSDLVSCVNEYQNYITKYAVDNNN